MCIRDREITTEGGLDLNKNKNKLIEIVKKFKKAKIRTSLFVDPTIRDIKLSKLINADCIELHTGKISSLVKSKKKYNAELNRIKKSVLKAKQLKLEVHAGHGLDYKTTKVLTKVSGIEEFNIGHFIIGCLLYTSPSPRD